MNIINRVLALKYFQEKPPVLVDIGASGQIHPRWKRLAKYSICIAFDADERDLEYSKKESKDYKELYVINSIVNEQESEEQKFYLTAHPHCSSMLHPEDEKLNGWSYAPKFKVVKEIQIKATTINKSLQKLKIPYIDWMKLDSQGLDLRIFKSVEDSIRDKMIIVEFEPGIMNAYKTEDKMYSVLEYMNDESKFWIADFILKGAQRIDAELFDKLFPSPFLKKIAEHTITKSPGWAEMIYLSYFNKNEDWSVRDYLLGWVISTLSFQHGFAAELAKRGKVLGESNLFEELYDHSIKSIKSSLFSTKLIVPTLKNIIKRFR